MSVFLSPCLLFSLFREHQKLHWKKHKSSCCAYKVSLVKVFVTKAVLCIVSTRFAVHQTSAATWWPPETWSPESSSSPRHLWSSDPRWGMMIMMMMMISIHSRLWQYQCVLVATSLLMAGVNYFESRKGGGGLTWRGRRICGTILVLNCLSAENYFP